MFVLVTSTSSSSTISSCPLQELTRWTVTADEEEEGEQELDVSAMTLLEVEQQLLGRAARQGQKLVLLQALAIMVESLPHNVLLRKITQVSKDICFEQCRVFFLGTVCRILSQSD